MILGVYRETQRLQAAETLVAHLPDDDELRSHFAKYMCVLTSGYLEECVRLLLRNYCQHQAGPAVFRFVESAIADITGLKEDKLKALLEQFDPEWARRFEAHSTQQHKDALDSVVANRHLIAHGRYMGISLGTSLSYTTRVKEAVRILDEQCINGS